MFKKWTCKLANPRKYAFQEFSAPGRPKFPITSPAYSSNKSGRSFCFNWWKFWNVRTTSPSFIPPLWGSVSGRKPSSVVTIAYCNWLTFQKNILPLVSSFRGRFFSIWSLVNRAYRKPKNTRTIKHLKNKKENWSWSLSKKWMNENFKFGVIVAKRAPNENSEHSDLTVCLDNRCVTLTIDEWNCQLEHKIFSSLVSKLLTNYQKNVIILANWSLSND